nr:importin-9 isoform X2 [Ipomoea batatas]
MANCKVPKHEAHALSALMPFLYARMFSSIAKFSSVINRGNIQQFLYAAVKAIGMDVYITRHLMKQCIWCLRHCRLL